MYLVVLILLFLQLTTSLCFNYWKIRSQLIKEDQSDVIGSTIVLSETEKVVNNILKKLKFEEYDAGYKNESIFLPAQHFFNSKSKIEQSKVFKFIQHVPKGANLHSHDTALSSTKFLFELTYRDNLYVCYMGRNFLMKFFNSSYVDNSCRWYLLKELRKTKPHIDRFIFSQFSLVVENPKETYKTESDVWEKFQNIFEVVTPLISYRPIFEEYFYNSLKELYEDNVLYLEFRGQLLPVYELNGTEYDYLTVADIYYNVLKKFKRDYPDFLGAKLIFGPNRFVDNVTAWKYVDMVKKLKERRPDFIAGFDLVGRESQGYPLKNFYQQILSLEGKVKFFFHAGETKWYGTETDENLVDAILFNTSRIGHGYALTKHPKLLNIIKEKQIAIEINPISNQVLRYVNDLRNHPAVSFMNRNIPVVVCNDDPCFWGAKGLSYDWYLVFMGLSSRNTDLSFLKQLAINSLKFAAFSDENERAFAFSVWEKKWNEFISKIYHKYLQTDFINQF